MTPIIITMPRELALDASFDRERFLREEAERRGFKVSAAEVAAANLRPREPSGALAVEFELEGVPA